MNWNLEGSREATRLLNSGSSATQTSHHVAQNSNTTILPRNVFQSASAPVGACSKWVSCNGGAGLPECTTAIAEGTAKTAATIRAQIDFIGGLLILARNYPPQTRTLASAATPNYFKITSRIGERSPLPGALAFDLAGITNTVGCATLRGFRRVGIEELGRNVFTSGSPLPPGLSDRIPRTCFAAPTATSIRLRSGVSPETQSDRCERSSARSGG